MAGFVKVAKSNEIQLGYGKMVEVDVRKIALFNIDGAFYAMDDTCTHRGGPLSGGELHANQITCPWHGAVFDVTTGGVLRLACPCRSVAIQRPGGGRGYRSRDLDVAK